MTTRNLAGQPSQTLVWDDGQRLESLTDSSGTTEFLYGIDDSRVRRETGGTYTYYHADGTEYEHDGTTGTFTYYHRINGKTVGYTRDETTTWMSTDQINSTSLTRTDAGVNSIQRYTPRGELRTDGSLTTDHHYTGQITDGSTGLNFYNARYQDPVVGRFVSPDTINPNPANGQDYGRYTYVRNRPIVANDPTGHCTEFVDHGNGTFECNFYVGTGESASTVALVIEDGLGARCNEGLLGVQCMQREEAERPLTGGGVNWRTVWTVGSTIVVVACVASTAGGCSIAIVVVAGGNIALSAVDNDIFEDPEACQLGDFALDVVANAAPLAAGRIAKSSTMTVGNVNNPAKVPASDEFRHLSNTIINTGGASAQMATEGGSVCG